MHLFRILALTTALSGAALMTAPARAQDQAEARITNLIADSVRIESDRVLVAEGHVEVLQQDKRLLAERIVYDRNAGSLVIDGPIRLLDADGSVVLADSAELSDDMRNGLLRSARVMLDRQLQMAAASAYRIEGTHLQLDRAVASSCTICDTDESPVWEIRARRVVHDGIERQIHFDDAQLRIMGLPVAWTPYLRIPDPSLDRADGLLSPTFFNSSGRGFGFVLPYFKTLGPHRDLTFMPSLGSKDMQSMGLRYRQAFQTGMIELEGAVSRDRLVTGARGFLRARAHFMLPDGFGLHFRSESLSDPAYLRDYGFDDVDRTETELLISRTSLDEYAALRLKHVHSLRAYEVNSQIPQLMADATLIKRMPVRGLGGVATFSLDSHMHHRTSKLDFLGRDVRRLTGSASWRRDWLSTSGIVSSFEAGALADVYHITQDGPWSGTYQNFTPRAMFEMRWPWLRTDGNGTTDVIEPTFQLVWANPSNGLTNAGKRGDILNEDSVLVEFDEGNLFGFSRFPGHDRREAGTRINAGLSWTRSTASGWNIGASAGRVIRLTEKWQFNQSSGLSGNKSHWVTALHFAAPQNVQFQGRAIFDNELDLTRTEARLAMQRDRYELATSWLWYEADLQESRPRQTSEWELEGRVRLAEGWNARMVSLYDHTENYLARASFGVEYLTECMRFELGLNRKRTGNAKLRPTTEIGFRVDLVGVGFTGEGGTRRSCAA